MKTIATLILFFGFAAAHAQDPVLDLAKAKHDVFISGKNNGEITKEELLNPRGIETPDTSHFVSGFGVNILNIDYRTDSLGKKYAMSMGFPVKEGNQFTPEIRKQIEALPSGSEISIGDIYCYKRHKGKHYVSGISFKIK